MADKPTQDMRPIKEQFNEYAKHHQLILEALTIPLEVYAQYIKKMQDRDLFNLMSGLHQAHRKIVDAVCNTTRFEVKPSPAQFQDAEKVAPIIQLIEAELASRVPKEARKE